MVVFIVVSMDVSMIVGGIVSVGMDGVVSPILIELGLGMGFVVVEVQL